MRVHIWPKHSFSTRAEVPVLRILLGLEGFPTSPEILIHTLFKNLCSELLLLIWTWILQKQVSDWTFWHRGKKLWNNVYQNDNRNYFSSGYSADFDQLYCIVLYYFNFYLQWIYTFKLREKKAIHIGER